MTKKVILRYPAWRPGRIGTEEIHGTKELAEETGNFYVRWRSESGTSVRGTWFRIGHVEAQDILDHYA